MCQLCTEWEMQRITSKEAFRAIGEMITGKLDFKEQRHLEDLSEKILNSEVPFEESNAELDKQWQDGSRD